MTRRLSSRFDSADVSPGLLLWRATNRWQAMIRAALAPYELTHVQFVLLASLTWSDADGDLTQIELARQSGVDPMMASQVLRALEGKGLVRRRADPGDRRAIRVTPTAEGVALVNAANDAVEGVDDAFFGATGQLTGTLVEHLQRLGSIEAR
ncbi:MAG: MarR family transcriptional regulator [Microbacterium sp.]|jgi:DNA-binding MarR family transcriptional regulator|uniref:MarR family winged helix-turn-helix transcriptional regulator n=1 Tax=Microbacterium sp. TaxID=51671 RepID=UPI0028367692|nr:MarR family transcriptional regulator [Microbacterium sp.]MDR2322892.1 MarR family transcriptional regulator [Microbacterium sp.]